MPSKETKTPLIVTVTLNPARDRFVTVQNFLAGGLNRISRDRSFSGGKGNNVAEIICRMGFPCVATGFLAGQTGRLLERSMSEIGVEGAFVYTDGETRTNIKIMDEKTGVCTELNEQGPPVTEADTERMERTLCQIVSAGDVVAFSGSAPDGLPVDIYARLIRSVKTLGAKTILDADGSLLREGLRANPDAIKPNIDELSRLVGEKIRTPETAVTIIKNLHLAENRMVLLSMGTNGAMLFSGNSIWLMDAPNVSVVSTVGAGDAMTAALAIGLTCGAMEEDILRNAGAFAAMTVMSEHFERLSKETVSECLSTIQIRRSDPN
jgi:1-phosphofructokinase